MFSLNRIQLIGYLTQPVSVRQTPNGTSVADLNVATPYTFTTDSGETLSGVSYHSVTAWSGMADVAAQYLKPGSQLFLSGRLQTDSWEDEKTAEKKSKTRIVAMDMIMLDPRDGQIEVPASAKQLTQCLNRADIVGHITKDPEVRTTTSGQSVVSMGVATNERWKDRTSNETKERTEFHNVVIWGDLAKLAAETVKKGQRVHVNGRVQTRSWETKQGSKRYTTEVIADAVSLLGVKNTDLTYSNEAPVFSKTGKSPEVPVAVSSGMDASAHSMGSGQAPLSTSVPPVNYESEVRVEDLPF